MKLVILCHFSNEFVRANLPLFFSSKFGRFIRQILHRSEVGYSDFAMWNTNMIKLLEGRSDIEVHIVSPHVGLRHRIVNFSINGIFYHFFRSNLPYPISILYRRLNDGYRLNRRYVSKIIQNINPDIINLVGAENPYYSICGLDIEGIPVYLTCQTVYSNPDRLKMQDSPVSEEIWSIEQELFHKLKYFGCTGKLYFELIRQSNPNSIIFPTTFPSKEIIPDRSIIKEIDFVWFAVNVSKKKGIDDAIEALSRVKHKYPEVSLLVIGSIDNTMQNYLENIISRLNLHDNIIFKEPFKDHDEMLRFVQKARFALLPIKMDVIPGTIIESMQLGIPVVTSITSGTPSLNKDKETVLLSEIGNVNDLSSNMIRLMESKTLQNSLISNAFDWVKQNTNNKFIIERHIKQCNAIVANSKNQCDIPEDMLFTVTN